MHFLEHFLVPLSTPCDWLWNKTDDQPIIYQNQLVAVAKTIIRGNCEGSVERSRKVSHVREEGREKHARLAHFPRTSLAFAFARLKKTQNKRSPLNKAVGCSSSQHLRYVPSSVEHQLFPMSFIGDQSKRFWRLTGRCGPGGGLPVSDCVCSSLYFLGGFIRVGGATLIGFGSLEAEIQSTCSSKTYISNF